MHGPYPGELRTRSLANLVQGTVCKILAQERGNSPLHNLGNDRSRGNRRGHP